MSSYLTNYYDLPNNQSARVALSIPHLILKRHVIIKRYHMLKLSSSLNPGISWVICGKKISTSFLIRKSDVSKA